MKITKKWAREQGFGIYSYGRNRWSYEDEDGITHLIHNGVEVAKGRFVWSFGLDRWKYMDKDNIEHLIHNGVEVAKGRFVWSFGLDRWKYMDEDGVWSEVDLTKKP